MATSTFRRLLLALAVLAATGVLACDGSSSAPDRKVFRAGATRPYVAYLAGAPEGGAVDVRVDLEDGAIRVGTGPSCRQAVTEGSLTEAELNEGRALFTDDRIAEYEAASVEVSGGAAGDGGSGGALEGGAGVRADAGLALPPEDCDGDARHVTVWIYPESGNQNVVVTFPASGSSEPMAAEMLGYFEKLATEYGP